MIPCTEDSTITLICNEQAIPEFPKLLFGTQIETGEQYFDATSYIRQVSPGKSVNQFFVEYKPQIKALCESYEKPIAEICKVNEQRHLLIDSNFAFIFISYINPHFLGYMCDMMHDLLSVGVVVSDSYLAQAARTRLPKEVLKRMIDSEER